MTTYLYCGHMNQSFSILHGGEAKFYRGKCKRYYLKSRYLIIFPYLAPSRGLTTEQKLTKCLKKEQSSSLLKFDSIHQIQERKPNFQGIKWWVRLITIKIGNIHSARRTTIKGSASHHQKVNQSPITACHIDTKGQVKHVTQNQFCFSIHLKCILFFSMIL